MRSKILRNSLANFAGTAVPALVSVVTLPVIVQGLGETQYGVLALVLAIVGYFTILDVNVTAGSVKYLAEYHVLGKYENVRQVLSMGFLFYGSIGLIGGLGIMGSAPWLIRCLFDIPAELLSESTVALRLAGAGFMLSQLQFYLQSIPQGLHRYDISGRYEAVFGSMVPLITAATVLAGGGLVAIVAVRLVASIINVALLWRRVRSLLPEFHWSWPVGIIVRQLLSFSGFAYLKRIASVTYQHADKLIVASLVGVQALTAYVVPCTLVTRVVGMIFRLGGVIFPMASSLNATGEAEKLQRIYLVAIRYTVFLNGMICVILAILSEWLLGIWINQQFAARSGSILTLLALAAFANSLSSIPSLVADGLGHPRITGGFAIARALLGVSVAFILVGFYGVMGAAIAQLLVSVLMSLVFILYVHGSVVPVTLKRIFMRGYALPMVSVAIVGCPAWVAARWLGESPLVGLEIATLLLIYAGVVGYYVILRAEERSVLRSWIATRVAT